MNRKELLREIRAYLKASRESAYRFGARVLGDKAFVWKLKNSNREPWERTSTKVMAEIDAWWHTNSWHTPRPNFKKAKRRG